MSFAQLTKFTANPAIIKPVDREKRTRHAQSTAKIVPYLNLMNGIASRMKSVAGANLEALFILSQTCSNLHSVHGQTRRIGLSYHFDLGLLPVKFGSSLDVSEKAAMDFSPLNEAVNMLTNLTRAAGGHRFRYLVTTKSLNLATITIFFRPG